MGKRYIGRYLLQKKQEDRERTFTTIGIVVSIIGVLVTCFSVAFIGININAINNQNEIARISERNTRFTLAIEQLGSDENAIILGGIYALHRIAQEDKSYTENVFNILCAYVRDTTGLSKYQNSYVQEPSETIQTIVNILCKKNYRDVYDSLQIDFSGAYLVGIELSDANLTNGLFAFTNFANSNIHESDFSGSYCSNAIFSNARINLSSFSKATLSFSDFSNANMISGNFTDADLNYVSFAKVNAPGISFTNANLEGARLIGSNFNDGNLSRANLSNADLKAVNLYNAILDGANLASADLKGVDTAQPHVKKTLDDYIRSRINKPTDLSGIFGGYSEENSPFVGLPIVGFFTLEEAEQIINPKTPEEMVNEMIEMVQGMNESLLESNETLAEMNESMANMNETFVEINDIASENVSSLEDHIADIDGMNAMISEMNDKVNRMLEE